MKKTLMILVATCITTMPAFGIIKCVKKFSAGTKCVTSHIVSSSSATCDGVEVKIIKGYAKYEPGGTAVSFPEGLGTGEYTLGHGHMWCKMTYPIESLWISAGTASDYTCYDHLRETAFRESILTNIVQ